MRLLLLIFVAFLVGGAEGPAPATEPTPAVAKPEPGALRLQADPQLVQWIRLRIQKPLREHCAECHADGEREGGFRIERHYDIMSGGEDYPIGIRPWQPDRSPVLQMMEWKLDQDLNMPPKKKVPDQVLADVRKWIEMGAPWPAEDP